MKEQYYYYEPVQLFIWLSNSLNPCTYFVYFQLLQLLCKNLNIIYYSFKGKLWKLGGGGGSKKRLIVKENEEKGEKIGVKM